MIPFAILSGNFIFHDQAIRPEFRVLDLSADGFTFRTAEPFSPEHTPEAYQLHFFCFEESGYRDILLKDFRLTDESSDICGPEDCGSDDSSGADFYTLYRVQTEDSDFIQNSLLLQKNYMRYIRLKTETEPALLSQALTGYPATWEDSFPDSWENAGEELLSGLCTDEGWKHLVLPPLGLMLDSPLLWDLWLSMPTEEFYRIYLAGNHLEYHPFAAKSPSFLYIGNAWCFHLFPDLHVLSRIRRKAADENLSVVFVFAPTAEGQIDQALDRLKQILSVSENICPLSHPEIVINDWGLLCYLSSRTNNSLLKDSFCCIAGPLLQKRRKDPRLNYWKSCQNLGTGGLSENTWNALFFQDALLEQFPLSGVLSEACGYPYHLPGFSAALPAFHRDLILPFYQTNTASLCTLEAAVHRGSRGCQLPQAVCDSPCLQQTFLYPRGLGIAGRFNSLFGFDSRILSDSSYLSLFLQQGVDRLVLNFL